MRRRTRNWLLILATLLLVVLGHRLAPEPELRTAYFDVPKPMVIAHQGGDGLRPSNTLLAFQHAVDLGVDVLELDVHLTRDDTLVVMHDATVERTTDGHGALAAMTLAEIKTLDAAYHWPYHGDAHPYRGRGVRVPTLAEVLVRFPQLRFNVEIKADAEAPGRALCALLQRHHVTDRVLVASFHESPLDAFREACPGIPTSGHEGEVRWFYVLYRLGLAGFAQPAMSALQVPPQTGGYDLADAGFIAAARGRQLHVDFWTINDPAEMRRLIDLGAGGLITDRPDLLLDVLGRRQVSRRSGTSALRRGVSSSATRSALRRSSRLLRRSAGPLRRSGTFSAVSRDMVSPRPGSHAAAPEPEHGFRGSRGILPPRSGSLTRISTIGGLSIDHGGA